jgi:hypothetical protein
MGLHADLRGTAQARHPGGRHDHQDATATTRPGPGTTTAWTDLGAIPASPGRGDRGVRLVHGGDDPAQDLHVLFFLQLSTRRVVAAGARGDGQP